MLHKISKIWVNHWILINSTIHFNILDTTRKILEILIIRRRPLTLNLIQIAKICFTIIVCSKEELVTALSNFRYLLQFKKCPWMELKFVTVQKIFQLKTLVQDDQTEYFPSNAKYKTKCRLKRVRQPWTAPINKSSNSTRIPTAI